mmetsp:Transcript_73394/g.123631  ORF Transcript_73394/g.123631 Transcript_73394/m.123631 type:complete len:145 (+) Transcript_73394:1127-1561(+)
MIATADRRFLWQSMPLSQIMWTQKNVRMEMTASTHAAANTGIQSPENRLRTANTGVGVSTNTAANTAIQSWKEPVRSCRMEVSRCKSEGEPIISNKSKARASETLSRAGDAGTSSIASHRVVKKMGSKESPKVSPFFFQNVNTQ